MNDDSVLAINPRMEILRQRLFISHDNKSQRSITNEYTILSKKSDLTNLIFISKNVLPNLLVQDDQGTILSVMPTKYTKELLQQFVEKSFGLEKEKLKFFISEITKNKLHLIWIKIPKNNALKINEIRNFTLSYSPKHSELPKSILIMKIKKQPYPLYYTLFTPNEFDFEQTSYMILKDGQITISHTQPDCVEKIKTHNSNIFRLTSDIDTNFAIAYSFKPTSEATFSTKLGVCALMILATPAYAVQILGNYEDSLLYQYHVQIALFIIGGALLLPD